MPDVHGAITRAGLANSGLPASMINTVVNANVGQDDGAALNRPPFNDPANHGDNGPAGIQSAINRMLERWRNILGSKDKCKSCADVNRMLQEFGKILHGIQDLYAHSNYVETMDQATNGQSQVGTIPLWGMPGIRAGITSGNYVHPIEVLQGHAPAVPPTHDQMAKDNPTFPAGQVQNAAGVSMYDLAVDLATRATADAWTKLQRQLYGSPMWAQLQRCIEAARKAAASQPASRPTSRPSSQPTGELLHDIP